MTVHPSRFRPVKMNIYNMKIRNTDFQEEEYIRDLMKPPSDQNEMGSCEELEE